MISTLIFIISKICTNKKFRRYWTAKYILSRGSIIFKEWKCSQLGFSHFIVVIYNKTLLNFKLLRRNWNEYHTGEYKLQKVYWSSKMKLKTSKHKMFVISCFVWITNLEVTFLGDYGPKFLMSLQSNFLGLKSPKSLTRTEHKLWRALVLSNSSCAPLFRRAHHITKLGAFMTCLASLERENGSHHICDYPFLEVTQRHFHVNYQRWETMSTSQAGRMD